MCLFVNLHYKHKQAEVSDCITTKDKQEIKLARLCTKVWRSCSQQLKPTNGTLCLISIDQSFNLYISHKLLCKKIHWKGYQIVRRPFLHSSFAFWLFLKSFVITFGCEDGLRSWNNATCTTVKLICLLNTALKQSVWCAHSLKYLLEQHSTKQARGGCDWEPEGPWCLLFPHGRSLSTYFLCQTQLTVNKKFCNLIVQTVL